MNKTNDRSDRITELGNEIAKALEHHWAYFGEEITVTIKRGAVTIDRGAAKAEREIPLRLDLIKVLESQVLLLTETGEPRPERIAPICELARTISMLTMNEKKGGQY
jgi:hypothetical protein